MLVAQDTEAEGQTTAGGLGEVEKRPLDYQGLSLTERWDANIGRTAEKVRILSRCQVLTKLTVLCAHSHYLQVEAIANLIKARNLLIPLDNPA